MTPSRTSTVFRPGPGQYIWNLGWAALPIVAGVGLIYLALTPQAQDRNALIAAGVVITIGGMFLVAYLLGMKIEVDDERVSKVWLFGLVRKTIPVQQLSASVVKEHDKWWTYARVDFEAVDSRNVSELFGVHPFWVWRSRDVDALRAIAASSAQWRQAHPEPPGKLPPPTFGNLFSLVWRISYLGAFVAIWPLVVLYVNWGGPAALLGAVIFELMLIALSAWLLWWR